MEVDDDRQPVGVGGVEQEAVARQVGRVVPAAGRLVGLPREGEPHGVGAEGGDAAEEVIGRRRNRLAGLEIEREVRGHLGPVADVHPAEHDFAAQPVEQPGTLDGEPPARRGGRSRERGPSPGDLRRLALARSLAGIATEEQRRGQRSEGGAEEAAGVEWSGAHVVPFEGWAGE